MAKKCTYCRSPFTPKYSSFEKTCQDENCQTKIRELQYEKQRKKQEDMRSGTTRKVVKQIAKVSEKRKVENLKYTATRIVFLGKKENQTCFIDGCGKKATTVEHICGRKGFYDDWARENNISLYLDQRFWRPCCLSHNLELENNPELSKQYQLNKISGKPKL